MIAMMAYEELKGALGRERFFRAPRYDARKLFPRTPPRVRVGSGLHQLRNISVGGLAMAYNPMEENLPAVGDMTHLTLQQSGLTIFESMAKICRYENRPAGSTVAFSFVDTSVEFGKLLSRNAQAQIAANTQGFSPNAALVPAEYRAFCAEALAVLRSYKGILGEVAAAARDAGHAFDSNSCYEACETRLLQQWRSLWHTGNDLTRSVLSDPEALQATKEFTELVLTPELLSGPIWDRAFNKPLGYPGDFEVMNYLYSGQRTGSDTYAQLMHRLGLECAQCVVTRMEVVREKIAETVRASRSRPARILSLGCGPAREVELYLAANATLPGRVEFTLVDQEEMALLQASSRTRPHLMRLNGRAQLNCFNMSFTEILRAGSDLDKVPPQDLIYSVGLLDYLKNSRAMSLTRRLYNSLAPGGVLVIGNMNEAPMSTIWPMEMVTDWNLHYRDEAQMLSWAHGLPGSMAWTEVESTGFVRLLFIRKQPLQAD